jgi:4-amino-4-deoxy-L-arabinose transferase-like glycosyltransferase
LITDQAAAPAASGPRRSVTSAWPESASPPLPAPNRRFAVAAILALFAFSLAFSGSRGIWDPDEGRYINVALEMIKSGDWWTPRLNHESPHFSKPPLTYWTIATSVSILGRNEWAARLPNTLAWGGTVLVVFALARRLAPGREWLAATIQATSLYPFVAANIVTTDTLLAFFEALAVLGFVRSRWDPPGKGRLRSGILWMWIGFGLAFFTKGPPGLLPLAAIVAFVVASEGVRGLPRLVDGLGIVLFLVLSFGWYGAQIAAHPDLLGYLLGQEVVGRLTSPKFNRNAGLGGIVRVYAPVVLTGLLPWAPWAVASGIRRLRTAGGSAPARTPESRFLLWWILLPLCVFLVSTSRLPLYLLPLAAPMSLLVARALPPDALAPRRRRIWLFVWLAFLLSIKAVAGEVPTDRDGRRLASELRGLLPYEPLEVVTINRKPLYSLVFYLDAEMEAIALDDNVAALSDPAYSKKETLAEELAEAEPAVVYLVPRLAEESFHQELERLGWRARKAGKIERLEVYLPPQRVERR